MNGRIGIKVEARAATPVEEKAGAGASRGRRTRRTRRAADLQGPAEDSIAEARSEGLPLDPELRALMERLFGRDFSQVRIHNDARAATLARSLHAQAFAVEGHIYVHEDYYHPETPEGRYLIAHELAHILQQPVGRAEAGEGRAEAGAAVMRESDPLEGEANAAASRVATGRPVAEGTLSEQVPRATALIARQPLTAVPPTRPGRDAVDPDEAIRALAERVLNSLRRDSEDVGGQVRDLLGRLAPDTRAAVLDQVQRRLPLAQWTKLNDILAAPVVEPGQSEAPATPDETTPPAEVQGTPPAEVQGTPPAEVQGAPATPVGAAGAQPQPAPEGSVAPEGRAAPEQAAITRPGSEATTAPPTAQPAPAVEPLAPPAPAMQQTPATTQQTPATTQQTPATTQQTPPQMQPAPPLEGGRSKAPAADQQAPAAVAAVPAPAQPAAPATQAQAPAQPVAGESDESGARGDTRQLDELESRMAAPPPRRDRSRPADAADVSGSGPAEIAGAGPAEVRATGSAAVPPGSPDVDDERRSATPAVGGGVGTLTSTPSNEEPLAEAEETVADRAEVPSALAPPATAPAQAATVASEGGAAVSAAPPPAAGVDSSLTAIVAEAQAPVPSSAVPELTTAPTAATASPASAATASPASAATGSPVQGAELPAPAALQPDGAVSADAAARMTAPAPAAPMAAAPVPVMPTAPPPELAGQDQAEASAAQAAVARSSAALQGDAAQAEMLPARQAMLAPGSALQPVDSALQPAGSVAPAVENAPPLGQAAGAQQPAAAPATAGDSAGAPGQVTAAPDQAPSSQAAGEQGAGGVDYCQIINQMGAGRGGDGNDAAPTGAGGAGGGGGAAIEEQPQPEAPDVSQAEPSAALGQVAGLPPAQLQGALGAVSGAAAHSVSRQREDLNANPPQMERPSGMVPGAAPSAPEASGMGQAAPTVPRVPQGANVPVPPPPGPPAVPASPVQAVSGPRVGGDPHGQLSAADAQALQSSVHALPTTDPALQVTAGEAPRLTLEGNADPNRVVEQRGQLDRSAAQAQAQGRQDVAQPTGENDIRPDVPRETLTADLQARPGAGPGAVAAPVPQAAPAASATAGGAGAAAGGDDAAVSIVAQQKRGDQIQAAVGQARGDMDRGKQEQARTATEARANAQTDIENQVRENGAQQAEQRTTAQTEALRQRQDWSQEQRTLVDSANTDADQAHQQADRDVAAQSNRAQTEAQQHIQQGNSDIAAARRSGEQEAERERHNAESQSHGVLDWLADRARAFFDGVKNAIKQAFDRARQLIQSAIQRAQQLAQQVIERARQTIVTALNTAAGLLGQIGDRLLAGFPALRDRFRAAIRTAVNIATRAVNALAEGLKRTVQLALNLLGRALLAYLALYEAVLQAAVTAVGQAVQAAISFARTIVQALAAFAQLIKDIAANPGQWLRNLGAAVVDGIRNHLWNAFKTAVKNWFNQKVEEVLGLARMIWQILTRGCLSLATIGRMAWEAVKSAIPGILIRLLIEKLVAMIVPAAGAVMAIVEAIQAAWPTIARIIQAIQAFFTFLKAVKNGNAGPLFAQAVAATAIAVIDFVANWLLRRLRGPAQGVSSRLGAIAQRIMQGLRRAGQAVRRVVGRVVQAVRRVVGRVVQAVRQGVRWVGRQLARAGRAVVRVLSRTSIGRALIRGARRVQRAFRQVRDRVRQWWQNRRPPDPQQRLDRAVDAIRPRLAWLLRRGVRGFVLGFVLAGLRLWYRLSQLRVQGGHHFQVHAQVNPGKPVIDGVDMEAEELLLFIREVATQIRDSDAARQGSEQILASRKIAESESGGVIHRYDVPEAAGLPAVLQASMQMRKRGRGRVDILGFGESAVFRQQGWGGTENKLVYRMIGGRRSRENLDYAQLAAELESMGGRQKVAGAIQTWMQTRTVPAGFDRDAIAHIANIMFVQEAHRNPASLVTSAMALQLPREGLTWQRALTLFPMSGAGAPAEARALNTYLQNWQRARERGRDAPRLNAAARRMFDAEVEVIRTWVRTLNLKFENEAEAGTKKEQLKRQIRQRMYAFYGMPLASGA